MRQERAVKAGLITVTLIIVFGFVLFPTYWLLVTSFKPNSAAFDVPPAFIPRPFTTHTYAGQLGAGASFLTYLRNSAITSVGTAALTLFAAIPAGYALSRLRFPARRAAMVVILASQMFPVAVMVITLYVLFRRLGLLDTYPAMILAFTSLSLPFAVWMMRGFFDTVPGELEDAAAVDGAGRLQAVVRVLLPLIVPGVVAVALFSFLTSWNNLLIALSLTSSQGMRTIPPGFVLTYVGQFQDYWSNAMAGSAMATLPTVILFISLQRFLVRGLTAGAIKG